MSKRVLTKVIALAPIAALLINPVQTMAKSTDSSLKMNNVAAAKKAKYEK